MQAHVRRSTRKEAHHRSYLVPGCTLPRSHGEPTHGSGSPCQFQRCVILFHHHQSAQVVVLECETAAKRGMASRLGRGRGLRRQLSEHREVDAHIRILVSAAECFINPLITMELRFERGTVYVASPCRGVQSGVFYLLSSTVLGV